jgi:hypothetical protein
VLPNAGRIPWACEAVSDSSVDETSGERRECDSACRHSGKLIGRAEELHQEEDSSVRSVSEAAICAVYDQVETLAPDDRSIGYQHRAIPPLNRGHL